MLEWALFLEVPTWDGIFAHLKPNAVRSLGALLGNIGNTVGAKYTDPLCTTLQVGHSPVREGIAHSHQPFWNCSNTATSHHRVLKV